MEFAGYITKKYFKKSGRGRFVFICSSIEMKHNRFGNFVPKETAKFVAVGDLALLMDKRCGIGSGICFEYENMFSANRVTRIIN